MSKANLSDFQRGYEYARRQYRELVETNSPEEILELAVALLHTTGSTQELARGMGTYYKEMVLRAES